MTRQTCPWGLALGLLTLPLAFAPSAFGQPISPMDGQPLPPVIQQIMEERPNAFTFENAYIQQAARLRQNRELVAAGLLGAGMSDEELMALTTVSGTRSVPVLLGKYNNTGADPITPATLNTELFVGPWPPYGTMKQYYAEISYNNLSLQGTVTPFTTLPNSNTFYEGPAGAFGLGVGGNAGQFVYDLLVANDPTLNYGLYDNDGPDGQPNSGDDDGFVDFIAAVQPKKGAECGGAGNTAIWSHRWNLGGWPCGIYTTADTRSGGGFIKVKDYVIIPSLSCSSGMIEIGVFCHEFGHAFGLPDLYDTNSTQTSGTCLTDPGQGLGEWCLMGAGNWNTPACPAHMSAWCKSQLGWINPTLVTQNLGNWPVASSTITPTAFKLWCGTVGNEYFLAENRRAFGFDQFIHAQGLLVYHVDESSGTTNANECHKRVDLECADAYSLADHTLNTDDLDANINRGDAGDVFCSPKVFTNASFPSSVSYSGAQTNVGVTDIQFCGNQDMRVDFNVCNPVGTVDLCIRDCNSDGCQEPSPCPVFWEAPDLFIDNNQDGIQDAPAYNIPNWIGARVRNTTNVAATAVTVTFYYNDPSLSLQFPNGTGMMTAGSTVIPIIGANSSVIAWLNWTIPAPPANVNHWCAGVVASNAADPVAPTTAVYAPVDNNIAGANLSALAARAGTAVPPQPVDGGDTASRSSLALLDPPYTFTSYIQLCNTTSTAGLVQIRLGHPPDYIDGDLPAGWSMELSQTQEWLLPHDCITVALTVTDHHPVHMDRVVVPLTSLINGQVIGGVTQTFSIDNVRPLPPCDFTAVASSTPQGDDNPGQDAIRVSWSKQTLDVLGFPENVAEWNIFRGTSASFVPSLSNRVARTCIDEDPLTPNWDHFVDTAGDPAAIWYKMYALDAAGTSSDTCVTMLSTSVDAPENGSQLDSDRATLSILSSNPGPRTVRLGLSQPRSGRVQIKIFDLSGRAIATVVDEDGALGYHQTRWDGRRSDGTPASAGLYFVRLRFEGQSVTQRLVLLK